MLETLRRVEATTDQYSGSSEAFDREVQRVKKELREVTDRLEGVRVQVDALTRRSDEARARQDATLAASRFTGRLEEALLTYERLRGDSAIVAEVDALRDRETELRAAVNENQTREKVKIATQEVAGFAHRILPRLDVQHPNYAITLSVDDLSIKVLGGGREDYLWQIGRTGCRITSPCSSRSINYFFTLPASPVSSLIIFDQPSQVYFPRRLVERVGDAPDAVSFDDLRDVDTKAVKAIFEVLADYAAAVNGRLQIIVLDHAAETIWGDIENVAPAALWREDNRERLVPLEWIEAAASPSTTEGLGRVSRTGRPYQVR